ncbi:hypothetical protein ABW53_09040 [Stutzerimonas stutzeri]|nr:hypothetical protein ABW53_09040 [Stutzerimonas stutzeri]
MRLKHTLIYQSPLTNDYIVSNCDTLSHNHLSTNPNMISNSYTFWLIKFFACLQIQNMMGIGCSQRNIIREQTALSRLYTATRLAQEVNTIYSSTTTDLNNLIISTMPEVRLLDINIILDNYIIIIP